MFFAFRLFCVCQHLLDLATHPCRRYATNRSLTDGFVPCSGTMAGCILLRMHRQLFGVRRDLCFVSLTLYTSAQPIIHQYHKYVGQSALRIFWILLLLLFPFFKAGLRNKHVSDVVPQKNCKHRHRSQAFQSCKAMQQIHNLFNPQVTNVIYIWSTHS